MPIADADRRERFPKLIPDGGLDKSPATPQRDYNCIAFTLGIENVVWWPGRDECFWPIEDEDQSFENFENVFSSHGYSKCDDGSFEPGFEKVAFYVSRGEITHAAKQMPDGRWKSKLGLDWEDVEHNTLIGVESNSYGVARKFLKRPVPL